jgi:zinc-binding alcohol dehydrogenase/oxidoreductase
MNRLGIGPERVAGCRKRKPPIMQAARLHETGGPSNLRVEDVPEPEAVEGQTVVRVAAAALNHRDAFITQGLYPNIVLPRILGSDCCGEAGGHEVVVNPTIGWGADERVWDPGATILGMPADGTFAQFVAVPSENVHPKPEHLSVEEAAALPLGGVTAYRAAFVCAGLQSGETVLITGVGGGVQTFALLYAKAIGARAVVTSSRDGKLERAKALGADVAINYATTPDWHKAVRAAVGTVDVAIDSAGGDSFAKTLTLVKPGGRVVTYGGTTGDATIKMFPVFWNQLSVFGTSMGSPGDFAAMLEFVSRHRITPVVDRVYELAEIGIALQRMDDALQFGKIVLRISP